MSTMMGRVQSEYLHTYRTIYGEHNTRIKSQQLENGFTVVYAINAVIFSLFFSVKIENALVDKNI